MSHIFTFMPLKPLTFYCYLEQLIRIRFYHHNNRWNTTHLHMSPHSKLRLVHCTRANRLIFITLHLEACQTINSIVSHWFRIKDINDCNHTAMHSYALPFWVKNARYVPEQFQTIQFLTKDVFNYHFTNEHKFEAMCFS